MKNIIFNNDIVSFSIGILKTQVFFARNQCVIFIILLHFWNHFKWALGCKFISLRRDAHGYALHVFPGETVSRLRSHEARLLGYRRVVALIRESGNGDSETFEPFPTPILLSRLEPFHSRTWKRAVRRSLDPQCNAQRVNHETQDTILTFEVDI